MRRPTWFTWDCAARRTGGCCAPSASAITIFATNNRRDFLKLFGRLEFHNGLIVIVPAVNVPAQKRLFGLALDEVDRLEQTINRVIEVREDGTVEMRDWPAPG
jgi:hypothetical protein